MVITRRALLIQTATLLGMAVIPLGERGWALALGPETRRRKRLIVLMQRGAVDGLSMVVPFTERAYFDRRPTIAIPEPGEPEGAINLDDRFGLHPALKSLQPYWASGHLGIVHASGSPDATRSHFDAQDYMESGTPGVKSTADGWLNRLLAEMPEATSPVEAVGVGPRLPRILQGKMVTTNLALGRGATKYQPVDRPKVQKVFDRLYGGNDPLSLAYREGLETRHRLMEDLREENRVANAGAPGPGGFSQTVRQVAALLKRNSSVRIVFLDIGGWDTHVNQGGSDGPLAKNLAFLGDGLAALAEGLGDVFNDSVILTLSEFGRTAAENGNGGTDHGRANVITLLGGNVNGGAIHGDWPGLENDDLEENRDLAVATDFRHVIAAVLKGHFGISDLSVAKVFPAMPTPKQWPKVMRRAS
jgi:uncharacterized protein (DUF1501 family)